MAGDALFRTCFLSVCDHEPLYGMKWRDLLQRESELNAETKLAAFDTSSRTTYTIHEMQFTIFEKF